MQGDLEAAHDRMREGEHAQSVVAFPSPHLLWFFPVSLRSCRLAGNEEGKRKTANINEWQEMDDGASGTGNRALTGRTVRFTRIF